MAMYLDEIPIYTITMIGMWSINAFLRYIRKKSINSVTMSPPAWYVTSTSPTYQDFGCRHHGTYLDIETIAKQLQRKLIWVASPLKLSSCRRWCPGRRPMERGDQRGRQEIKYNFGQGNRRLIENNQTKRHGNHTSRCRGQNGVSYLSKGRGREV